jgi:hypothetical protein
MIGEVLGFTVAALVSSALVGFGLAQLTIWRDKRMMMRRMWEDAEASTVKWTRHHEGG